MSNKLLSLAALMLLVLSGTANAVTVQLVAHNQRSSSGTLSTLKWDGCATFTSTTACINPANANLAAMGITPSTAVWDWNPATGVLSMTGSFNTASTIGSSGAAAASAVIGDKVVDMVIDTVNGTTTATSYTCAEGNFLAAVGAHGCANVSTGGDFTYDGSVAYNVGGAAGCVTRTISGDDASTGNPRGVTTVAAAPPCDAQDGGFDLWNVLDNTATGGQLIIRNSIPDTDPGTNYLTFSVVPDAVDDSAVAFQDTPVTIDVLANDTSFADPVTVTKTDGTSGTVVVNGSGNQADIDVTYTPNAGFSGTDTFTYTVVDNNAATDTATVTVTVSALGANDDTATTRWNTPVTVDVLANDVGYTNPVTVTKTDGTNGTVVVNGSPGNQADIDVTYTPIANFSGTDTFTYTVSDGIAPDDTATVTVTVTNEVPTAATGTITISTAGFDPSARTGTFNAATGNNLGDAPSTVVASDGTTGTTSETGTTVTYTPNATFFQGTDTFSYTITDEDNETATNTVTVNIADALPVLANATITTTADTASAARTLTITLGNGSAAQHPLSVTTQAANGSCALSSTTAVTGTSVTYTPNAAYTGGDSCVVTITDENGTGDTATGTLTITVNAASGGSGGSGGLLPGGSGAFDPWSLALLAGLPLLGRLRASRRRLAAGIQ